MNAKELAEKLNGREYLNEITKAECDEALASGLVVVFGRSDDLMEFRGAILDEQYAWGGTTAYLTSKGLVKNECEDGCPYFEDMKSSAVTVVALWWDQGGVSWTYKTDIPHETFDIFEDGNFYCRGIVFALADVVVQ